MKKTIIIDEKYYDPLADLIEMFPDIYGPDEDDGGGMPLLPLTDEEREILNAKLRGALLEARKDILFNRYLERFFEG